MWQLSCLCTLFSKIQKCVLFKRGDSEISSLMMRILKVMYTVKYVKISCEQSGLFFFFFHCGSDSYCFVFAVEYF